MIIVIMHNILPASLDYRTWPKQKTNKKEVKIKSIGAGRDWLGFGFGWHV